MKNIIAISAVLLVTGCSSLGLGSGTNTTSARSTMGATDASSYSIDREPVIKKDGRLSLYHGG